LHKTCPEYWNPSDVGLSIRWPNDTLACDGSDLMISCIANNPGTIGYVDAGRGWSLLQEVHLRNNDGRFITSQVAAKQGGILSSTFNKTFPSSNDQNFGELEFFDEVNYLCNSFFSVSMSFSQLSSLSPATIPGP